MIPYTRVVVKPHPELQPNVISSGSLHNSLNHVMYQIASYKSIWPQGEIRLYPCGINSPVLLSKIENLEIWEEAMTYDEFMEYLE